MKLDMIEQDEFLKEILAKEQTPVLPEDFTLKLMEAVEQETARKARIYEPLISRQVWRRIAFAIVGLIMLQLIISLAGVITWPDLNNLKLFSSSKLTLPSLLNLSNYSDYLPKLLVVVGACLSLWLWEKVQKFISHRSNSF